MINDRDHISSAIRYASTQKRAFPYATAANHAWRAAIQHCRKHYGTGEYDAGPNALAELQAGRVVTIKWWVTVAESTDVLTDNSKLAGTITVRLIMDTARDMKRKYFTIEVL